MILKEKKGMSDWRHAGVLRLSPLTEKTFEWLLSAASLVYYLLTFMVKFHTCGLNVAFIAS